MTTVSPTIKVFNFESEEILNNENELVECINRGYNTPRVTYKIILTPRIKSSLLKDLLIINPKNSYIALMLLPDPISSVSTNDDAIRVKNNFLEKYPLQKINLNNYKIEIDNSVNSENEKVKLDKDFKSKLIGMVCIKPFKNLKLEYEVTGFVSFYPGVGKQLMEFLDVFAEKNLNLKKLYVDVIEEHEICEMYEKFGYTFVSRTLIKFNDDKKNGAIENELLEEGISATRDFNLVWMEKVLQ